MSFTHNQTNEHATGITQARSGRICELSLEMHGTIPRRKKDHRSVLWLMKTNMEI